MTKESLAKLLDGREIENEITKEEIRQAKERGLIVLFGASDDLAEFRGAIHDEVSIYDGGTILINKDGPLEKHDDCECKYCGFEDKSKQAKKIEALWCNEGAYSWTYKTDIPHATFEIVEDGEPYCRGIVFNVSDL